MKEVGTVRPDAMVLYLQEGIAVVEVVLLCPIASDAKTKYSPIHKIRYNSSDFS